MKRLYTYLKKKRFLIAGVLVLLVAIAFMVFHIVDDEREIHAATGVSRNDFDIKWMGKEFLNITGDELLMDKNLGYISITQKSTSTVTVTEYRWEVLNDTDITLVDGSGTDTESIIGSNTVTLRAKTVGSTPIRIVIKSKDENGNDLPDFDISLNVKAPLAIYNSLSEVNSSTINNTKFNKIYKTDQELSLIMKADGYVSYGTESSTDEYLSLIVGSAQDLKWSTDESRIVSIDETNHLIEAQGVGHTKIYYQKKDEDTKYPIDVYVKPDVTTIGNQTVDVNGTTSVTAKDGDFITINNLSSIAGMPMSQRIEWAIARDTSEKEKVSDCKDTNFDDKEAYLFWNEANGQYQLKGKAGQYTVFFFVAGTYQNYDTSVKNIGEVYGVEILDIQTYFGAWIKSGFDDPDKKDVTITVGGQVSLSEFLNISLETLCNDECFDVEVDPVYASYLSADYPNRIFTGLKKGEAKIKITYLSDSPIAIPGATHGEIEINVHIVPSFSLNYSNLALAKGQSAELSPVLNDGLGSIVHEGAVYSWETSDKSKTYTELEEFGKTAKITAKRETPINYKVVVTMYWTEDGVTLSASCNVTVNWSLDPIPIDPKSVTMNVGESKEIGLTGTQIEPIPSLVWVSSDEEIVKIESRDGGSVNMRLIAGDKSGVAIVTVINPANNAFATCIVTVRKPITGVEIYQGTTKIENGGSFTVEKTKKYLQLEAKVLPADTTETDIEWSILNAGTTTVVSMKAEEKNTHKIDLSLLSAGTAKVTVQSKHNREAFSTFDLVVTETKITNIQLTEKEINIKVGENYTIVPKLTPDKPDDAVLNWETSDASKVKVDANGVITGVGVGQAVITVSGGTAKPVSVIVNVRAGLTSIAFEYTNLELAKYDTFQLNVIFNPAENVNKSLHFATTDSNIVNVDAKGMLTANEEGMALITCWADDIGPDKPISCLVTVSKEVIEAESFEIFPEEETIRVGDSFEIIPEFSPSDTSDQQVVYKSRNESIASVDENGVVVGISEGTTVISCTPPKTKNNDLEEKFCIVTVLPEVSLEISPVNKTIAKGSSFTINAVVMPEDEKDTPMEWYSEDENVASVSQNGKVTGLGYGVTTITCTLTEYDISATCRVTVAKLKTTLKLDKTSIRINVGQSYTLKKTVTTNASKKPSVVFSTANKKIATVGKSSGKVKGKKVGSTTITAKTTDSIQAKAKCRVIVIRRATSISLNKNYASCVIGRSIKLKATIKPKNASIKKVRWTTTNSKIAVVNGGKITGIAEGEVYIIATTTDGSNKSARCYVKVTPEIPVTNIMVAQTQLTMKKGDKANLSYTVIPNNTSDHLSFASDNKRVAKVSSKGKVTAIGTGTCSITVTSTSGVTNQVTVNVVALDRNSITMRQYDTVSLNVFGTSDTITWYSGNNRIATVSGGKVVGRGKGTTYIYAYVGGCKMACKVKVVSVNSKVR